MFISSQTLFLALAVLTATTNGSPVPDGTDELVVRAPSGSGTIIGFRSVPKDTAAQYKKDGTINGQAGGNSGQIGQGIYLSQGPRDWPGPSLCVVYADPAKWHKAQKMWIPEQSETSGKTLWYKPSDTDAYIKEYKLDPAKTIRFSPISGKEGAMQLVIPPSLLGKSALGITVQCEDTPQDDSKLAKPLSYSSMTKDWGIGGPKPGSPPPSREGSPKPDSESKPGSPKGSPPSSPKSGSPKPGSPKPPSSPKGKPKKT